MSKLNKPRIIHVGLPKAASTLLQNHIFSSLDDYLWLGAVATANIGRDNRRGTGDSIYLQDEDLRRFYNILLNATEEGFRQQLAVAIALEDSLVGKYSDKSGSKGVIFSSEFLTSTFFCYSNVHKKADRIHAIWPEAKIILVIREQNSIIASQYADQPFDPRSMIESKAVPIQKWLELDRERGESSLQNSLNYLKLYQRYCKLFGQDNIHVLLFEDIVNDKEKIANQLCEIFGGELETKVVIQKLAYLVNSKPGALFQRLRMLKRVLSPKLRLGSQPGMQRVFSFLSRVGPPVAVPNHEEVKSLIGDLYRQSNQDLETLANLQMSRYGYLR